MGTKMYFCTNCRKWIICDPVTGSLFCETCGQRLICPEEMGVLPMPDEIDQWMFRLCANEWKYCNGRCRSCSRSRSSTSDRTYLYYQFYSVQD